jgi:hypothetical protein
MALTAFILALASACATDPDSQTASAPQGAGVIVTATGVGYPPKHLRGAQAGLMARRAAEVNAMRNLAAKQGLPASARLGPFRYIAERKIGGGGVEVTVQSNASGSVPPCNTSARPKCNPKPKPSQVKPRPHKP